MFNLRSPDLDLLTGFEAIYELGTVSDAADRLALSQSATGHALSWLRDACRDDLFVQARQGLSPTPLEKDIYPAIKSALEALRATLMPAPSWRRQLTGTRAAQGEALNRARRRSRIAIDFLRPGPGIGCIRYRRSRSPWREPA